MAVTPKAADKATKSKRFMVILLGAAATRDARGLLAKATRHIAAVSSHWTRYSRVVAHCRCTLSLHATSAPRENVVSTTEEIISMATSLETGSDYQDLKLKLTGYTHPGHELHRNVLFDALFASIP